LYYFYFQYSDALLLQKKCDLQNAKKEELKQINSVQNGRITALRTIVPRAYKTTNNTNTNNSNKAHNVPNDSQIAEMILSQIKEEKIPIQSRIPFAIEIR
jgi:hypothetical protein